jgi:hypothetical protein
MLKVEDYEAMRRACLGTRWPVEVLHMLIGAYNAIYYTLSLLHCKNVVTVDAPPTPAKVAQKRLKERGVPDLRFKTLTVWDMRRVRKEQAEGTGVGGQRSLHLVRGHFKTFGGENGLLFGKWGGTYW